MFKLSYDIKIHIIKTIFLESDHWSDKKNKLLFKCNSNYYLSSFKILK